MRINRLAALPIFWLALGACSSPKHRSELAALASTVTTESIAQTDPQPTPDSSVVEHKKELVVVLTKMHCYDVNDGFVNGHSDETYWKEHFGPNTYRDIQTGDFKNGTSRRFQRTVLYRNGSGIVTFMDDDPNGADDYIGSFKVKLPGFEILPGRDTKKRKLPSNAPPGSTWLLMKGSGARYEARLLVTSLPVAQ